METAARVMELQAQILDLEQADLPALQVIAQAQAQTLQALATTTKTLLMIRIKGQEMMENLTEAEKMVKVTMEEVGTAKGTATAGKEDTASE